MSLVSRPCTGPSQSPSETQLAALLASPLFAAGLDNEELLDEAPATSLSVGTSKGTQTKPPLRRMGACACPSMALVAVVTLAPHVTCQLLACSASVRGLSSATAPASASSTADRDDCTSVYCRAAALSWQDLPGGVLSSPSQWPSRLSCPPPCPCSACSSIVGLLSSFTACFCLPPNVCLRA